MTSQNIKKLRTLRIVSQALFFGYFVTIFVRSLDPFHPAENPFLRFDFLIFLTHLKVELRYLLPIAGIIVLTVIVGRYFCGWVCPLGSLIDAFDALFSPLRRAFPFKGCLAPFRRKFAASPPSWFILGAALVAIFFTPPVLQFFHPNVWIVRIFSLSALGISFAGFLVILSLISRRFWCAYLCPLGAFYGIIGKISLFRLSITECSGCRRCAACPMDAADYLRKEIIDHQCTLCFDYEHRCPVAGFSYGKRRLGGAASAVPAEPPFPAASAVPSETAEGKLAYGESRRLFLRQGAVFLGGLVAGSLLPLFDRTIKTGLVRPPGVRNETEFVRRCVRCMQCVRSCPNRIIKATGLEAGFDSLFTPHIEFNEFGCDYDCQVCQLVCPNYAIPLQSLPEKQSTMMGLASIDEDLCVVYAKDTNCLVCEEFCPVPEKAIKFIEKKKTVRGELLLLRYPVVVDELCIGCGKCEGNCPVEEKAIIVSSV